MILNTGFCLLASILSTRYELGFTKKGNSHKIKLSIKLKGEILLSQEFIMIGKVVSTQGNKGDY
jgi:hypothetical protein